MQLRLRRGFLMVEKIPDGAMSLGLILNPERVTSRFGLHLPNPKTFHYEAHCMLHEPHKFDEDLTGCHLIIDQFAGVEYILPVNGRQRTVHFILESAVLAVIEAEGDSTMTKGQFKNYLDGMFNNELKGIEEGDQVTPEILDNVEVAFEAIMERARDEDDDCEDDDENEIKDAEGNDLEGPPPPEEGGAVPDTEVKSPSSAKLDDEGSFR
jgi:hypothetical protein